MKTDTDTLTDDIARLPIEANRRSDEAERRLGRTVARHTESVLPPLLNRDEHRIVREHLALELAQGFEHQRETMSLVMESRLQSIREACNHVLITGKTHLRQERIAYFSEVYRQLEARMQALADTYIADADIRFARLGAIAAKHLREREQRRQEKAALDFLDTLDALMDEFRGIIGETVGGPPSISRDGGDELA
jgi:hypothetical protein